MYYVWTNYSDKEKRLRVAGADSFESATHYAMKYLGEGSVSILHRNRIMATLH